MEKLNLEVQVVLTEKQTLKKELERIDSLYVKIQRDYREYRV